MRQFFKYLFVIVGLIAVAILLVGSLNNRFENKSEVTIDARASKVFAVYNNPLLMNHWIKDFKSLEKTSGQLNQIGSQWLISFKSKTKEAVTLEKTLREFKADSLLKYDYQNAWLQGSESISFNRPTPTTTQVTLTQSYAGTGILKNAFFYFMQDGVAQANQSNLERFKKLVEDTQADELLDDQE